MCGAKVGAQRSPLPYSDFDALRLVSRRSPLARGIADRTRPSAIQECRCFDVPRTRSWGRSEEHTSELQSLMRISYAVFCLKKNISSLSFFLFFLFLSLFFSLLF